jgi:hypothetical protein
MRALAIAALALAGCTATAPADHPATPSPAPTPTVLSLVVHSQGTRGQPVHLSLTREGRRIYTIAAEANVSRQGGEGSGQSDFVNPHVIFYDRHGTTLFADSPSASVSERDRTIVMTGGVQASTSTGIRLTCRTLTFDDRTALLHGEGDVVMTTARGERLSGDRVDADTRLSQVHISSGPAR